MSYETIYEDDELMYEDSSEESNTSDPPITKDSLLIAIIADEDTCVGYLLGGIGQVDENQHPNYFVVEQATTPRDIEDAFLKFVKRKDIGIVLITQKAAEMIHYTFHTYKQKMPTVIQIPDKNGPYDIYTDHLLKIAGLSESYLTEDIFHSREQLNIEEKKI